MLNRRIMMQLTMAGLADVLSQAADAPKTTSRSKPVFEQALPDIDMKNWVMTASEVHYNPGETSTAHQHAGFVAGYVLEGEVRFQLKGQAEKIVRTGEMFFEPPGSIHQVSGNASPTKPARMLALIFAEHGAQLTRPA